jgi:hypothetical protein
MSSDRSLNESTSEVFGSESLLKDALGRFALFSLDNSAGKRNSCANEISGGAQQAKAIQKIEIKTIRAVRLVVGVPDDRSTVFAASSYIIEWKSIFQSLLIAGMDLRRVLKDAVDRECRAQWWNRA